MKYRALGRAWKIAVVSIIAAYITVDIVLDKDMTKDSIDWTRRAQSDGDQGLRWVCIMYSTIFTYWIILFLHIYMAFAKDTVYYLYLLSLFLFSILISYVLKAIYYRGKPFAISNEIYGECACDPGMPSGHADAAAIGYIILYMAVFPRHTKATKEEKLSMAFLLILFCSAMTIFILLALIYLGTNTYSQVIIGALVAIGTASLFTFRVWLRWVFAVKNHIKKIAAIFFLLLTIYLLAMLFINSYGRENPSYWKYFSQQCPHCHDSWVYGQTRALAVLYFIPVYYFFYPFVNSPSIPSPRVTARETVAANQAQPVAAPQTVIYPGQVEVVPFGLVESNCPDVQINPYLNPASINYQPYQLNPPDQFPQEPPPFNNFQRYSPRRNSPRSSPHADIPPHRNSPRTFQQQNSPRAPQQQRNSPRSDSQTMRTGSDDAQRRPARIEFSRRDLWARYGWLFIITFPAIVLLVIFFFAIQHQLLRSSASVQVQSIVAWLFYGILFMYLGWAFTYLKTKVYDRHGLLAYQDFIYFDDLKTRLETLS